MSYRKFFMKNNFLGGEASPLLEGRSDLVQYQLGCQKLRDFIALKGGGATRRPGTRHFARTGIASGSSGAGSSRNARIFPFIIGDGESYIVEVSSNGTTTSWKMVANSTTPATADFLNVTSTGAGFFLEAELFEFQFAVIGANCYIVHPNHKPIVLSRISTSNFDLNFMDGITGSLIGSSDRGSRNPYLPVANGSSITLTPSATSGTGITLTASANMFVTAHVGAWFNLNGGYVLVTAFNSVTEVVGDVIGGALTGTGADNAWREGSWSAYRGYPRAIGVYNQRLVMGGSTFYPDTLWFSQVNDYPQFWTGSANPDDPVELQLASDTFNQIQWIVGSKKLAIGTTSGEWVGLLEVTSAGDLNIQFNQETAHGSAYIQAKRVSYTTNFVQRSLKSLRELAFNFDSDSYVATDLNIFSSHIAAETDLDKIVQIDWQEAPFQCLWTVTQNGKLFGLTRDRQQQVASWHSHQLGNGYTTSPERLASVLSVAVAPSPDNKYDRVWMVVQRSVNNVTVYNLEWMGRFRENMADIDPGDAANSPSLETTKVHLDSVKIFDASSTPTTTVTGMTHLTSDSRAYCVAVNATDYDEVRLVYDGYVTVDGSGNVELPIACDFAWVGLLPAARINTLPQDGTEGPPVYPGATRRVDKVYLRLKDTYGLSVGAARLQKRHGLEENADVTPLPFFDDTAQVNASFQRTFSGIVEIESPTDYDQESGLALVKEDPWPCTILSVTSRMMVNEV